jgi:hypothetical protein
MLHNYLLQKNICIQIQESYEQSHDYFIDPTTQF